MNNYQRLVLEYDGIYGTIDEYTSDSKIQNYLCKLKDAIAEANYEAIKYTLSKIDKWYDENINSIKTNEFVFNIKTHQDNITLIKEII